MFSLQRLWFLNVLWVKRKVSLTTANRMAFVHACPWVMCGPPKMCSQIKWNSVSPLKAGVLTGWSSAIDTVLRGSGNYEVEVEAN